VISHHGSALRRKAKISKAENAASHISRRKQKRKSRNSAQRKYHQAKKWRRLARRQKYENALPQSGI